MTARFVGGRDPARRTAAIAAITATPALAPIPTTRSGSSNTSRSTGAGEKVTNPPQGSWPASRPPPTVIAIPTQEAHKAMAASRRGLRGRAWIPVCSRRSSWSSKASKPPPAVQCHCRPGPLYPVLYGRSCDPVQLERLRRSVLARLEAPARTTQCRRSRVQLFRVQVDEVRDEPKVAVLSFPAICLTHVPNDRRPLHGVARPVISPWDGRVPTEDGFDRRYRSARDRRVIWETAMMLLGVRDGLGQRLAEYLLREVGVRLLEGPLDLTPEPDWLTAALHLPGVDPHSEHGTILPPFGPLRSVRGRSHESGRSGTGRSGGANARMPALHDASLRMDVELDQAVEKPRRQRTGAPWARHSAGILDHRFGVGWAVPLATPPHRGRLRVVRRFLSDGRQLGSDNLGEVHATGRAVQATVAALGRRAATGAEHGTTVARWAIRKCRSSTGPASAASRP